MKKRKSLKRKKLRSSPSLRNRRLIKKKLSKTKRVNRNELVIYIFNVVEDEWSFTSAIPPLEKRYEAINALNNASECYLFANASNQEFIYISPVKISNSFKKYFQGICNTKK